MSLKITRGFIALDSRDPPLDCVELVAVDSTGLIAVANGPVIDCYWLDNSTSSHPPHDSLPAQFVGHVSLVGNKGLLVEATSIHFDQGLLCVGSSDGGEGPLVFVHRLQLRPLFNPRHPKSCADPLMSLRLFCHTIPLDRPMSDGHICSAQVLPQQKMLACFLSKSRHALLLDWTLGHGEKLGTLVDDLVSDLFFTND